jgi:NRAMP (natural resistance-associated macrophage protein)-like metal ion transporter
MPRDADIVRAHPRRHHHWRRPCSAAHGLQLPPKKRRGLLAILGPGLITGASDDDPSGIATYSQAGAQFGYSTGWVMLFTWPLMAAIQEISARIGRVTGQGIAANLRDHYPAPLLYGIVALLVVANFINLGADLGAMGAALHLLVGGPTGLYVVLFAAACTVLEIYSSYARYVKILKWLTLSLFAYVATALVIDMPWGEIAHDTLIPSITWSVDYLVLIVAILGTTISPYMFFWQASEEAEEESIDPSKHPLTEAPDEARGEFRRIEIDTYIGMGLSNVIALFIIITTAATLHAHGITDIQTSAQAAEALRPIAGDFAYAVFALGILGTGLLAVPVLAGSAAYALAENHALGRWARSPAAGRQAFLRDDRGRHADRDRHQFRRYRPDQGVVLDRGDQRRRRRAADDRDDDHDDAAQGHGPLHLAAPAPDRRLDIDCGDGVHRGRDVRHLGQLSPTICRYRVRSPGRPA